MPQRELTPEEEIQQVMDLMSYGLYIVGTRGDAGVNGMMADWVMQVSFIPRLVAVSFENDARSLANVRETGVFTVNFLPQDRSGMDLARHFAQPYSGAKVRGRSAEEAARVHRKLEGVDYDLSEGGCPLLDGAIAWLECAEAECIPVGDHTLAIGQVTAGRLMRVAEPLTSVYTGWTYSG